MVMALGTVVIGGGSGFIGSAISKALRQIGYEVVIVSRQPGLNAISWNELRSDGLPKSSVAVINVAGQNVLDPTRRWTPGFKQNVFSSRVNTTKLLAGAIKDMPNPPKIFATISGVGYYKPSATEEYKEDSPGGDYDFFSRLCSEWEKAGCLPEELKVRRVIIRSGIVLGREGGMIKQLFWPFYFGIGGSVSSGKQYMPWIHIADIAGIFTHCIQSDDIDGVLNGVAPQIITNGEFTKAFAQSLWRPALIPLPQFALNLAFSEERAVMMTEGQKVIPHRTLQSGYEYKFPDINSACKDCARVFA